MKGRKSRTESGRCSLRSVDKMVRAAPSLNMALDAVPPVKTHICLACIS